MTSNEIRTSFLNFFERHGHRVVPSSPLVPGDDPTLLFTNAGMNQFKDVFLGRDKRDFTRAASSQKCARAGGKHNDLENVGRTARHLTFFEMLGNFSFGDYFKADAIRFAWELLVEVYALDASRLWFSVFEGDAAVRADDEAAALWIEAGASPDRVLRFGRKDNFWSMGDTGPCGPCSEIHYFRGADLSRNTPDLVNGPGDDTMEIWNLVFMQYDRDKGGNLTPLPAPSVDTGAGLERLTTVLQRVSSVYDIDSFAAIMDAIADLSGHRYGGDMDDDLDTASRVICDHARSTTFLISDGVIPSNEGRGYVLRKIMRRAMRHGKHLGLNEPFLHRLVAVLAREMGDAYPELRANRELIEKTIVAEEKRFDAVLTDGLPRLEAEIAKSIERADRVLPGEAAFRLYDTFGVPYDFIEDTASTRDIRVDLAGFEAAMEAQRGQARARSTFGKGKEGVRFGIAVEEDFPDLTQLGDHFVGYDTLTADTRAEALWDEDGNPVTSLPNNSSGYVALKSTPFYLESGGQVSDTGVLKDRTTGAIATIKGVVRIRADLPRAHKVRVGGGAIRATDSILAEVDGGVRDATRRNHTATHLLHAALRQVLGAHVKQAGSLVAPDRLRFDFVHFQQVTQDELDRIERIVNEQIVRNAAVDTNVRSTQDAIAAGAMALFGEKYGDTVRVVSIPGFSMELCGGTHVSATGDIGPFVIVSEGGVAAGVRRIEALTGHAAVAWVQERRAALRRMTGALHVAEDQAVESIERLQADVKKLSREVTQLKTRIAMGGSAAGGGDAETIDVAGVTLARRRVKDLDKDALRGLADSLKARIKSGVVVLANETDGKVQVVVAVTPDLVARVKAGQVVKELAPIVGGGGGGRPDFAEAGGKQPERIDEMLRSAPGTIQRLLAGS